MQAHLDRLTSQNPQEEKKAAVQADKVLSSAPQKHSGSGSNLSLFQRDPEENYRLWVDKYFDTDSISREDAIRQFLARPLESRIQSLVEDNQPSDKPPDTEKSKVATTEPTNGFRQGHASIDKTELRSGLSPKLITATSSNSKSRLSRKRLNWLVAITMCSVVGLLIITFLWATPMREALQHAASAIPVVQSSSTSPRADTTAPLSENHGRIQNRPANEMPVGHIASLSIGCPQTQPCIRIDTLGKVRAPKLRVLTDPDRLVIDFQGVSYAPPNRLLAVGRGSVKDVRVGMDGGGNSGNTRVVVDLLSKCQYELHTFTDTFVLNVYPEELGASPNATSSDTARP